MQLFHSIEEISHECAKAAQGCNPLKKGSAITIGNFDGVHLGHKALINRVLARAHEHDLCSAAITFTPHPLQALQGKKAPPLINSTALRVEYLATLGLDYTLLLEFSQALATLEPEEFVERYLVQGCHLRCLVIGYDYSFGRGRRGNAALLTELGEHYDFSVEQLPPVLLNGEVISSTRIREYVSTGREEEAAKLMGRFYALEGEVVHGFKRGAALLGFPTANIQTEAESLLPERGVYACFAHLDDKILPAVANVGYNPHFGNDKLSLECHILDFSGDLYGQWLRVSFVRRLRGEAKFSGLEALITQIRKDIEEARPILHEAFCSPLMGHCLSPSA